MAGATLRAPSSPEEWIADLDRSIADNLALLGQINQAAESRRATAREALDAAVARLSVGTASTGDEAVSLSDGRPPFRDGSGGRPFVPLPKRTTHGGPWGPAVAAKLRDEAIGRRRW